MDVWFCVTRRNRAERHNREVMNTLSETTRRSPERYGKALPHLTKTYHGSPLIGKFETDRVPWWSKLPQTPYFGRVNSLATMKSIYLVLAVLSLPVLLLGQIASPTPR